MINITLFLEIFPEEPQEKTLQQHIESECNVQILLSGPFP